MFEKICELLADKFDADASSMTMETSIKDDLNADSLDIVELMMDLEEQFGIEFTEEELSSDDFKIVGKLVAMVERKIASKEEKAT